MRVLIWHVHGSWMTNFVRGPHTYLIPRVDGGGPDGLGRATTWDWPANAVELAPDELADAAIDAVIVQRPRELELAEKWLGGRRLGRELPWVWLEHNAPQGPINQMRHAVADRDDVVVVQVTHTNALFWDTGSTRTRVIEHGILDPGHLWTGAEPAAAVAVNEPVRRARVVGTDLLARLATGMPIDLFGMGALQLHADLGRPAWLRPYENPTQSHLHRSMATRRCYLHPVRWTSLGLSLIEAMHLGMPVVALATTEVPAAVPRTAGVVSNDIGTLVRALGRLADDFDAAERMGRAARAHAVERYGLERFLADWDNLLEEL